MPISQDDVFALTKDYIEAGEDIESGEAAEFIDLLQELSNHFDDDARQIAAYIDIPIKHAVLSSDRLVEAFSTSLVQLHNDGIQLPDPQSLAPGIYRAWFIEDIERIKAFAMSVVHSHIDNNDKENRPRYRA